MTTQLTRMRMTPTAFQATQRHTRVKCRPAGVDGRRARAVVVRAQAGTEDDDFEKRLASLKKAKAKAKKPEQAASAAAAAAAPPKEKKAQDFSNEEVFFEGSPSVGDLITNIGLGATILWLPLSFAAVGRFAFVKYRVTDKRVQVTTALPWKTETAFVAYEDVKEVVAISRGLGYWGDMVVSKTNGEKLEIRAIDKWQEIRDYIRARSSGTQSKDVNPLSDDYTPTQAAQASTAGKKGFQ